MLAAAAGGGADLIVSGDVAVLVLGGFRNIRILTTTDALVVIARVG